MPLAAGEAEALDAIARAVDLTRKELGEAYLRFEEIRVAYEAASSKLKGAAARARQAEVDHESTMQNIAKVLQLPPGQWVYDAANSRLIRKGG